MRWLLTRPPALPARPAAAGELCGSRFSLYGPIISDCKTCSPNFTEKADTPAGFLNLDYSKTCKVKAAGSQDTQQLPGTLACTAGRKAGQQCAGPAAGN